MKPSPCMVDIRAGGNLTRKQLVSWPRQRFNLATWQLVSWPRQRGNLSPGQGNVSTWQRGNLSPGQGNVVNKHVIILKFYHFSPVIAIFNRLWFKEVYSVQFLSTKVEPKVVLF